MIENKRLLGLKRGKVRSMATVLTAIPVLAITAYTMSPELVNAATDDKICITATMAEDPTIFGQRGWCSNGNGSPGVGENEAPEAPTFVPGVSKGDVFADVVSNSTNIKRTVALNDGGSLVLTPNDELYIIKKRGLEEQKITGFDPKITSPTGVESSGDGQTIAVFNSRLIQVSWNGGLTWQPTKEMVYYAQSHNIMNVSIAESGNSIVTTGIGSMMSIMKDSNTWKNISTSYSSATNISTDGSKAIHPVFNYEYIRTYTLVDMKAIVSPSWYAHTFTTFAASGDLNTQLAVLDSYDDRADQKALGLRVSRDGGKTWKTLKTGKFTSLNISADAQVMTAVDSIGSLLLSKDSGATWINIDPIGGGVKVVALELAHDGKTMLIKGDNEKVYLTSVEQATPTP